MSQYYVNPGVAMAQSVSQWHGYPKYSPSHAALHGTYGSLGASNGRSSGPGSLGVGTEQNVMSIFPMSGGGAYAPVAGTGPLDTLRNKLMRPSHMSAPVAVSPYHHVKTMPDTGGRGGPVGDYIEMGFLEAGIGIKEVGAAAAAYHGMQRYGLRGALVWGLAGYFFPIIAVGAAVVQGYAKKGGDGGIVDTVVAPLAGPKLSGSGTTSLRKAYASR